MKFKSIFILLNVTLFLFLIILVLLPFFMLGASFMGFFWQLNWLFILILLMLITGFNVFYFINRQLFSLLEKEDWPALIRHLESRVIQKGRYSPQLVRLLANTYLVLSDSAAVMSFENKVAIIKPALLQANMLVFGTARILGGDISGAIRFFQTRKAAAKREQKDWVCWYYAFALLLDRRFEDAAGEFSLLSAMSNDGIIAGLSSYFLAENIARSLPQKRQEFTGTVAQGRERVLKTLPRQKDWQREVSRLSTEIHAAVLAKYMAETAHWLYTKQ